MSSNQIPLQTIEANDGLPTSGGSTLPHPRPQRTSTNIAKKYWQNAIKAYHLDRYRFRGFEMLHLLSIQYYERELCRMEWDICTNDGIAPAEEADKLRKIRSLLKEYSKWKLAVTVLQILASCH
jgi:hypothetical protein